MESIIQNDKTKCFLCGRNGQGDKLEEHHVFGGSNRKNSEKYGLKVYVCGNECHRNGKFSVHQNADVTKKVKRIAQFAAMTHYRWSEDEFRIIFVRSVYMNRVILLGRLTADPELKTTPQGTSVTRFTLAVDRRFKKEGGQQADFITCVAWRGTADCICKYFCKGKMIAVEGQIQSRTWDGQDGKRQYATEVIVDAAYFAGDSPHQTEMDNPSTASGPPPFNKGGFVGVDSGFVDIGADEDDLPF